MEGQISKKRLRPDSHNSSDLPSLEVKRLRDDLLDLLDDSDPDPTTQDLDSVIQSFAEEILPSPVSGVASDSGELGYLLVASDDELGLPPSGDSTSGGEKTDATELERVSSSESVGIDEIWGFEDPILNYDSFELGEGERYYNETVEYVGFDGLFEHSDVYSVFS